MKTFKGKIVIGRYMNSREPEDVTLKLIDATSGVEFAHVQMSAEAIGAALTGHGEEPCTITLGGIDAIGKVNETKEEVVFIRAAPSEKREQIARDAVSIHERDGWSARLDDCFNGHRTVRLHKGGADQRVSFHRFVDAPT